MILKPWKEGLALLIHLRLVYKYSISIVVFDSGHIRRPRAADGESGSEESFSILCRMNSGGNIDQTLLAIVLIIRNKKFRSVGQEITLEKG